MIDTINPSITAGIGAGSSDPFNMLYKFAATQNALNQNALFQQTFRARQAMGPIAQQSVGPDGQMDWDKFAVGISTHPDTAFMAPDVLNQIAQKKLIDAETTNQKLQATEKRLGIFSNLAAGASRTLTGEPGHDLVSWYSDARAAGGIDPQNEKAWIGKLAELNALPVPEQKARLAQMAMGTEQGRKALSDFNGTFNPKLGFDPATGQDIPGWVSPTMRTAQPMLPGGAAPQLAPTAAPPGQPDAATQPNFSYGEPSQAQSKKLQDIEGMRTDYNAQAAHATDLQRVADKLQYALSNMSGGGGASGYIEAAKFMQSLGVHNKNVDAIANGSLPAGATAQTLATMLGTSAVREMLLSHTQGEGSAGRLTNLEFQKIVDIFPNVDTDPRAAAYLFKFIEEQNKLRVAKAQTFNDTYSRFHAHQTLDGGMQDPTQFEPYWNQQLVKRGYISADTAKDISLEGAK